MDKQDNRLAISVVATLTAGIALIYTLIMYRTVILAVAGVSCIFLITAFILTQNIIAFAAMKNKSMNVHIKNCVDDISSQLEAMNGAQTQLGKATYIYTRQAAQRVATLENNYAESQEALHKNLAYLSNIQNKATKLMIKYDQNNTVKLIASIRDMRNRLNETMVSGFDQIQPNNSDVVAVLESIIDYLKTQASSSDQALGLQLNNVAHELQNISNSIQRAQVPAGAMVPSMAYAMSQPAGEPIPAVPVDFAAPAENAMPDAQPASSEPAEFSDGLFPGQEAIPADAAADLTADVQPAMTDTPNEGGADIITQADDALNLDTADAELTLENDPETENADIAQTGEADWNKDMPTTESADFTPTFTVISNAEPETLQAIPEDPNQKLSADEIAALFAANDPAPAAPPEPPEDPNKKLSADEIAALFAANDPTPAAPPEPPEDPNKKLSADEIAALIASMN